MSLDADKYESYLTEIIERHKNGVSLTLRQFGILKPPSPEVLILAYVRFKDRFANALDKLGIDISGGLQFADGKKSFKDILQTGIELVTTGATVFKAVKNPPKKNETNAPVDSPEGSGKILGVPQMIFWGLVTVTVLTAIFIYIKSKKS